jgi:hypothetical protein
MVKKIIKFIVNFLTCLVICLIARFTSDIFFPKNGDASNLIWFTAGMVWMGVWFLLDALRGSK